MMDVFDDITAFHAKFELLAEQKGLMDDRLFAFRVRFINEEVSEFEEAHDNNHLENALDANIDIMYVALGNLVMMGFSAAEMREAWRRVHEANLKKRRTYIPAESRRSSAFDVVKPAGWVKPDLSDLCK